MNWLWAEMGGRSLGLSQEGRPRLGGVWGRLPGEALQPSFGRGAVQGAQLRQQAFMLGRGA